MKASKIKRALLEKGASLADVLMAPLAVLSMPVVGLTGRLGWRAPLCRSIFEKVQATIVRHHYYNPIVYPADLTRDLGEPRELPGVDLREAAQVALLDALRYADEIGSGGLADFDYDNPNFSHDDVVILYSLIRHLDPKRVVEIGSGYSTLVTQEALKKNGTGARHICVEPFEMPWLERSGITVLRQRVEQLDLAPFLELEAGDVLFIDSSHIIRPQGDVLHEFLHILPRLRPGVIIHVHDVYTPYDYHPYLVIEQRKLWNEQYLMEALLSGGGSFEVMLANYWICRQRPEAFAGAVPGFTLPPKRDCCSFWFRKADDGADRRASTTI